jgi:hypothetical protein
VDRPRKAREAPPAIVDGKEFGSIAPKVLETAHNVLA